MFLTAYFSSMDIGISFSILLYDSDFLCLLLLLLLTHLFDDKGILLIFYVPIRGGFRAWPGPHPSPFCGLLNISALHVQYGIQVFAKFKRPECTRLHLRELQSQNFSRRSMRPKLPRKGRGSKSWWALSRPHCHCIIYLYRPPLSQNPPSAPGFNCSLLFCYYG